jgi:hypothetical protein
VDRKALFGILTAKPHPVHHDRRFHGPGTVEQGRCLLRIEAA